MVNIIFTTKANLNNPLKSSDQLIEVEIQKYE